MAAILLLPVVEAAGVVAAGLGAVLAAGPAFGGTLPPRYPLGLEEPERLVVVTLYMYFNQRAEP